MSEPPFANDHEDPLRDAAWLARVAADPAGDDGLEALGELMSTYDPVFLVNLLRAGLDIDAAKAALTTFWAKVGRRASTFDPRRGTAAAWLWTVLVGVRIDALARQRIDRGRITFGDSEEAVDAGAEPGRALWSAVADEATLLDVDCVRRVLQALSDRHPEGTQLLWDRLALEYKPEELARALGKPVHWVKKVLVEMRKLAREALRPCREGREPN